MLNLLWHWIIGNDADPRVVAVCRALLGATITGAVAFLGVWQATDEPKALITAGLLPFLTYLGARAGIEGTIDHYKNGR